MDFFSNSKPNLINKDIINNIEQIIINKKKKKNIRITFWMI